MPKASPRTEASIERAVCSYANKKGFMIRKMNGLGYAGWPDRLLVAPNGFHIWIEFKRPEGKLSPIQEIVIEKLIHRGQHVFVIDDVDVAKGIIDEYAAKDSIVSARQRSFAIRARDIR